MTSLPEPIARSRAAPVDVGAALVAVLALGVLVGASLLAGPPKTAIIAVFSFAAMVVGALAAGRSPRRPGTLAAVDGLAAGAMVTSAAAFLVPVAVRQSPTLGGIGLALGLLGGYVMHHLVCRVDPMGRAAGETTDRDTRGGVRGPALLNDDVLRLSVHAVGAGVVIGAIYGGLPDVGLLLGLSIVSHKGPAGYAAALRLRREGRSALALAVPAAGVGIPATALGIAGVGLSPPVAGLVFGAAAGIFLHLALDHLTPHHPTLDHAGPARADEGRGALPTASTLGAFGGAALVVVLWLVLRVS